jgi:tetratricopeptide (TPR) repeat protein
VALGVLVWHLGRRSPVLLFFAGFAAVTLLPGSNLVVPIGTIMAERLLYLPTAGLAACVALVATTLPPCLAWRRTGGVMLALVVTALTMRTVVRNRDWQDDVRLFASAVREAPRSFKTHQLLASALANRDAPRYPRIDLMVAEAEQALAIMEARPLPLVDQISSVPRDVGFYYELKGLTRAAAGAPPAESRWWYERAAAMLEHAVPIDQAANEEHRRRELERGRPPEAIEDVGNYEIYQHLGRVYDRLGRHQDALGAFATFRHLAPNKAGAHIGLARASLATGQPADAALSALRALALDGGSAEAWQLLRDSYAMIDGGACAILVDHDGRPQLNGTCPLLRRHVCIAYEGLAALYVEARQPELADRIRELASRVYRCAAAAGGGQP